MCVNFCRALKNMRFVSLDSFSLGLVHKNIVVYVPITENWLCYTFVKVI
jgi:hypothetical protein